MIDPLSEVGRQYSAFTKACGVADVSQRTQIEVMGSDKLALLHNLCTADIRKLTSGDGTEAFFTDVKGKILGFANVFCGPDSVVLETVPQQQDPLISHLDRYIIREDVQLFDRGSDWGEVLLSGPKAPQLLTEIGCAEPPSDLFSQIPLNLDGDAVAIRRVDITASTSFLIACVSSRTNGVMNLLKDSGAVVCGDEAVEIARVEMGTPSFGVDITNGNLPQEVGRDDRAISFTKGCYLGQETVARIDALGHVNWYLRQVKIESAEVPVAGDELTQGDKVVGRITSAVFSPLHGWPLALAYVRREQSETGTVLKMNGEPATVL